MQGFFQAFFQVSVPFFILGQPISVAAAPQPSPSPSAAVASPPVSMETQREAVNQIRKNEKKIPDYPFRCGRLILVAGKTVPCDSPMSRDGEYLRPIIEDVPEAVAELNTYQRNRRKVRFAAYTGTLGLVMGLTAPITRDLFVPAGAQYADDRRRTESVIRWSGFGISIGSVLFGLSSLRANEDHLRLAVLRYNQAHPDKPIELLFQTDF